jgi:hypothetical protein
VNGETRSAATLTAGDRARAGLRVPGRERRNPVRGHSDETKDSGQPGVIAPPDVCPQPLDASRTRTSQPKIR